MREVENNAEKRKIYSLYSEHAIFKYQSYLKEDKRNIQPGIISQVPFLFSKNTSTPYTVYTLQSTPYKCISIDLPNDSLLLGCEEADVLCQCHDGEGGDGEIVGHVPHNATQLPPMFIVHL